MQIIRQRLQAIMQHDRHATSGNYTIRSLYFDDYWNTAYTEKITGIYERKKYRIRIYNSSDAIIKLECKNKVGSVVRKTAVSLTREETERILQGDCHFLLKREEPLCHELYIQHLTRVLRPCVIVEYEREPFVHSAGDTRITFDKQIRASSVITDFFNPKLPTTPLLDSTKLVMEVKYTEFLPTMIKNALPPKASELTALSKFTGCFEKTERFRSLTSYGEW